MIKNGIALLAVLAFSVHVFAQTRVKSTATGGNWGTGTSWVGGVAPAATDTAEIVTGSTVTLGTSTGNTAAKVVISGTLSFATAGVSLTVNGDLLINSGGVFNPYFSSNGKQVTVIGNFVNNGQTDLSKNGFLLTMGQASVAKSISGTGVFTTGIIRSLTINNTHGVTLSVPLSVSYTLALTNGTFINGTKLTMDDKAYGNGSAPPYCVIERAQSSSLNSAYTLGTNAALYITYLTNPGGANSTLPITEANEVPASRAFFNLTVSHAPGINITDDITLKSSAAALTLTSGIIKMAAGKTIVCNSTSNAGVTGSSSSYVDGAVALTVGNTAAIRTFPIGSNGKNRRVVLSGLQATTGALTVRLVLDTTLTINAGMGVMIKGNRKWKASVLSGTLSQFTSISINYNTDDGVTNAGLIARSIDGYSSYNSTGAGSNTASAIVSPVSTYTSLGYYALASPFSIVTRSGDKLLQNGQEFRFVGINAYTLTGIATPNWHFLNDYEVEDVFKTCNQMGINVVRTLMFSIKGGEANGSLPSHIMGYRSYNDTIFRKFDKVLQLANKYKVRLIVPFIGNAKSRGGINQFAKLSNASKDSSVFYTDTAIRSDYKHFVNYVLTRTNYYTGVQYKNDPAILAWETGNELRDMTDLATKMASVDSWTVAVSAYIKSVDSNHLLMDGKESTVYCKTHCTTPSQLNNPNIDIITEHYYVGNYVNLCNQTRTATTGLKVFVVGEFSSSSATVHQQLLSEVVTNGTSGALLWSLTNHSSLGGFYYKGSPDSAGNAEYRWPGFASASATSEATKMTDLRSYSYLIQNITKPARPIPASPYLLPSSTRNHITWQGAAGAVSYVVERATDTTSTWTVIDTAAREDMIPYTAYVDTIANGTFYYRVKAKNGSGVSASSNIVGPMRDRMYIRSTPAGGSWSLTTTWQGGIIPTAADTVEIVAGSTVYPNIACQAGPLKILGTLGTKSNGSSLLVNGNLFINTGGVFTHYFGTAGPVTVKGNFINNGQADFSVDSCTLTMAQAAGATSISGTGSFTTGVLRSLIISNTYGVTLFMPISVSEQLSLSNGVFTNGTNLTLDNNTVGTGSALSFCTLQRSQSSSISSSYSLGATAALYIAYVTNTSGANTSSAITEGNEIPASRTFYNLTANHAPGINIANDITLKSSASAITLTSGIIKMASGKTLICNSAANTGVAGSDNSYVDGAVALTAGTTAATKTFPIGKNGKNRKVVITGLQASTGTVALRFVLDSATSATAGTGISLSTYRKWKGTVLGGTLSQFTKIGIDYKADDGVSSSSIIASCATLNGVYNSMGNGANTATAINSPTGTYTSTLYYALANVSAGLMSSSLKTAVPANDIASKMEPAATSLLIYPNPATGDNETSIQINGLQSKTCTIIITDINGRLMKKQLVNINGAAYNYKFSTSGWKPGIYAVSVKAESFIKQTELLVK